MYKNFISNWDMCACGNPQSTKYNHSWLPQDSTYWLLVPVVLYHSVAMAVTRVSGYLPFFFFVVWILLQATSRRRIRFDKRESILFAKAFFCYLLYILIPTIYWLFDHSEATAPLAQALNNISLFIVLYVSFCKGKFREIRFLFYVMLVGFCISGAQAFLFQSSSQVVVQGARSIVGMSQIGHTDETYNAALDAIMGGLGGYSFVYNCAFLLPTVFCAFILIKMRFLKIMLIGLALALIICIKTGGLHTPLMISAFGILLVVGGVVFKASRFIRYGVVIGILAMTFYIVYPRIYCFLSPVMRLMAQSMSDEGAYRKRMEFLAETFEGDKNNYAYLRYDRQRLSFMTFCENPLFGVGVYDPFTRDNKGMVANYKIGGHSFFLDMMAKRGIVGTIPFVLFIVYMIKYFKRISMNLYGREWLIMIYVYLAGYTFGGIANPVPQIPASFYLFVAGAALYLKSTEQSLELHRVA